jgi:methanethiol S-methyltransferase
MRRLMILAYGFTAYVLFLATFLYAIAFVGDFSFAVPKTIHSGEPADFLTALLINVCLLGAFGLQHSIMARPEFKQRWTRIVPKPIERSTFVFFTCAVFALLFWQWRPMPETVWAVESGAAYAALTAVSLLGWGFVVVATFMIHHFDLFGLRQTWLAARGDQYRDLGFRTPGMYRFVRHPIMLGFLVAFWATPVMSEGRLLFAVVTTCYIAVALQLEERDLIRAHGERYLAYKRQVPSVIPSLRRRVKTDAPVEVSAR